MIFESSTFATFPMENLRIERGTQHCNNIHDVPFERTEQVTTYRVEKRWYTCRTMFLLTITTNSKKPISIATCSKVIRGGLSHVYRDCLSTVAKMHVHEVR